MPGVRFVLKSDEVKLYKKVSIKARISHNGKVRYISTPYKIEPKYFNDGKIKSSYQGQSTLNGALIALDSEYNNIIAGIDTDIYAMDINSLVNRLKAKKQHGSSFTSYFNYRIDQLRKENRYSYADSYLVTAGHLKTFRGSDIDFKDITVAFLKDFERHLRLVNNSKVNTCRIYLNNIRAVYYHAVDNEVIKGDISPFRKFKIEQEKKRPRTLDIQDMRRLLVAHPYLSNSEKREVDVFFLSLYTGGTNLKDLLYLKPDDFYKGRIVYSRFKTGREYSIRIFPEAEVLINKYRGEKYLLRFMEEKEQRTPKNRAGYEHKDLLQNTNKYLKLAGEAVGLKIRLNTYVARYTFATIASKIGISKDIIRHILGHGMNTMTDLYIDFDQEQADQAMEKVIKEVNNYCRMQVAEVTVDPDVEG